jgi:formylglycine-generating enzyme required for sulfatase activity
VLGAAAAAAVSMSALAGDAVQWRVTDGGNGHWYRLVFAEGTYGWLAAERQAESIGGHLGTIGSNEENAFVALIASDSSAWRGVGDFYGPWLGGFQDPSSSNYSEPDGGWRWVTGEAWGFTAWCPGLPNNAGSQDYLHFYSPTVGQVGALWDDVEENLIYPPIDGPLVMSSIVEWSADCNSDGVVDYGQILNGYLVDANTNGVPDSCECATNPGLPSCCIGDIVGDRIINGADLGTLLSYWGPRTSGSFSIASDLNGDGRIDGSDLGMLLSNWGTCPTASVPSWATVIETQPDPAVVTDAALRAAIVATGLPWRVRDTGTGIEMLLVPPGAFQLGCSQGSNTYPCNQLELPAHAVTITRPYYIGRYEVTQQEWERRTGTNPSNFRGFADSGNRPVDSVTWMAAQSFGTTTGLRLPTEAEWEFACRAGTGTAFYNGTNDDSTVPNFAWCPANAGDETHPVGQLAPNALGFHDMLGNVYEWTSDWFDYYTGNAKIDPTGPIQGTYRVIRGGAWYLDMISVRSSFRIYGNLDGQYPYVGFRVARNP